MKYKFDYTTRFKKAYRKLSSRDRRYVDTAIERLLSGEGLPAKYRTARSQEISRAIGTATYILIWPLSTRRRMTSCC